MRPDPSDQLAGAAHVLADLIAPLVADAYALDVLNGVIANLRMLAESLDAVAPFLLWDIDQASGVLGLAGIAVPHRDVHPFDMAALRDRHREVRGLLESSIDAVRADSDADRAATEYFRERSVRFPLVNTYRGGSLARPPR